ncbi:hypothetical protein K5549_007278 [Capra hircus]|uniref:G-protein coupled receptors family 1 profile domain-containing protein n=1 Tax=Capra hircus TaxID=9925 RepID=A0A452F7T2_CAPHI|nr:hypothetical protein K5549_007278 [Capra hircus]
MKYEEMEVEDNMSTVIQFVLLGFSDLPNLQGLLFGVFSIIYIIIFIGNSLIIIITTLDAALHKPMILVNLWTQDRTISVLDCVAQMCFFLILGATECFLLVVMAYDCCVAICDPLHYPLIMTPKVCLQLAVGSWVSGIPVQIGQVCQIFSPHFCHLNEINHFSYTSARELSVCALALFVAVPFRLILASYSKIISTILRLPTARGQAKTFSTCSFHLLVVVLFFGSAAIAYSRPKSMTPMFNPMIYSLRNKDAIEALRKLLLKK